MSNRPTSIKPSHLHHQISLKAQETISSSNLKPTSTPLPPTSSSSDWSSKRFGFDDAASPNLSISSHLTPQSTPLHSRLPSIEKLSSQQPSPSNTFFDYDFNQISQSRTRSPLGPHLLSPSRQPDDLFSPRPSPSTNSTDRQSDTRIEFDRISSIPLSPATGISSSIAVNNLLKSNHPILTPIVHSRNSHPTTTHRRFNSLDQLNRTSSSDLFIRKSIPPPISVPNLTAWSEKSIDVLSSSSETSSSNLQTSARSFLGGFFRIYPHLGPQIDSGSDTSSLDPQLITRSLLRLVLIFPLILIRFLLTPFGSIIFIPEFLHSSSISKSSGLSPHSKNRGRKLSNLIAMGYVIFSVFIFSQDLGIRLGFITRKTDDQLKAFKIRLISRNVDELVRVRHWATHRLRTNPQTNPSDTISSPDISLDSDPAPVLKVWDAQQAVQRKDVTGDLDLTSPSGQLNLNDEPLDSFSHPARFAKMHSKLGTEFTSEISPFLFKSTDPVDPSAITACLYTNPLWLSQLVHFVNQWPGPVSLVVESMASDRPQLVSTIEALRLDHHLIRSLVDFHLVSTPVSDSRRDHVLERMLIHPLATNAHLNLARFFSRTELVWLVGDPRITPGTGLYQHLLDDPIIRTRALQHGDAIVVPTFGFERTDATPKIYGTPTAEVALDYINQITHSLTLSRSQWPKSKEELVGLADEDPTGSSPVAMFDRQWAPNKGPTHWNLWKLLTDDPLLTLPADEGGGLGLGVEPEGLGGGQAIYRVSGYELNYAPNVIISREGQTWCTERFEVNKAACVYQMYLTGTELWVTPLGWAYTIEPMGGAKRAVDEAQRMLDSISARLYTKFHQEACMQYGREFLSLGTWEDDRARHLRAMCSNVLKSWGVGAVVTVSK